MNARLAFVVVLSGLFVAGPMHGRVVTAIEVAGYAPGAGAALQNPSAALGLPTPTVPGWGSSPAEELNPFAPHFTDSEIAQVLSGLPHVPQFSS